MCRPLRRAAAGAGGEWSHSGAEKASRGGSHFGLQDRSCLLGTCRSRRNPVISKSGPFLPDIASTPVEIGRMRPNSACKTGQRWLEVDQTRAELDRHRRESAPSVGRHRGESERDIGQTRTGACQCFLVVNRMWVDADRSRADSGRVRNDLGPVPTTHLGRSRPELPQHSPELLWDFALSGFEHILARCRPLRDDPAVSSTPDVQGFVGPVHVRTGDVALGDTQNQLRPVALCRLRPISAESVP